MNFAIRTTNARLFLAILFSLLSVVAWESVAAGDLLVAPKATVGARTIDPSTLPLPRGYTNSKFGNLVKWPKGPGNPATKLRMAKEQLKSVSSDMIRKLKSEGASPDVIKRWAEFYRAEAIRVPQNPTAAARAFYLEELLKLMGS